VHLRRKLVVEKMEKRLASWKKIFLSQGGCLILIKSKLSSLPTYFLSLFPLPAGMVRRLKRLCRDFLWDGLGSEPKLHLVNWKTIYSVPRGELGFNNLMLFNKDLLGISLEICAIGDFFTETGNRVSKEGVAI
jgi:hypothetical protein